MAAHQGVSSWGGASASLTSYCGGVMNLFTSWHYNYRIRKVKQATFAYKINIFECVVVRWWVVACQGLHCFGGGGGCPAILVHREIFYPLVSYRISM